MLKKYKKIITTQNIEALLDRKESFLDRSEIRVFRAVSNEEALVIHRSEKADLIIADLNGRLMGGEALCSTIRESKGLNKVSLIIMHSGTASDVLRLPHCRANAFIEQSNDPSMLLDAVYQLMSIPVRETFRAPIAVRVHCSSGIKHSMGYSENISVTGMLFDSEETLVKGGLISCWFVLPDSTHVRTEAEIVRIADRGSEHDPNQYGIRFLDIADACWTAIDNYVKKKLRNP
ncbi:MAG TPA: PilZ domain-containing protein [Thermodesulfovibrionales bacterium]|nr:PilZ domain-containing protein [Thermodesulfovibrionales bacterium]